VSVDVTSTEPTTPWQAAWGLWAKHRMFGIPCVVTRLEDSHKDVQPLVQWQRAYRLRDAQNQTDKNMEKVWDGNEDAPGLAVVIPPGYIVLDPDTDEAGDFVIGLGIVPTAPAWHSLRGTKLMFASDKTPESITYHVPACPGLEIRLPGSLLILPPTEGWEYAPGRSLLEATTIPYAPDNVATLFNGASRRFVSPIRKRVELPKEPIRTGEGRHEFLLSRGASLMGKGESADDALLTLLALNETFCDPPYDLENVRRIIDWVASREAEKVEATATKAGATPEETEPLIRRMTSLEGLETPPYLVYPVIPESAFVFFVGPEGSSKSEVARDHSIKLSLAGYRVIYFSEDMPPELDRVKMRRALGGLGQERIPDDLYWAERQGIDLSLPKWRDRIAAQAVDFGADLIVFDTYTSMFQGGLADKGYENWNIASAYTTTLKALSHGTGAAVLTICHPPTSKPGALPGGSSLAGIADQKVVFNGRYDGGRESFFTMKSDKNSRYTRFVYAGVIVGEEDEKSPLVLTLTPRNNSPAVDIIPKGARARWSTSSASSSSRTTTPGPVSTSPRESGPSSPPPSGVVRPLPVGAVPVARGTTIRALMP
jgi:AAA domain